MSTLELGKTEDWEKYRDMIEDMQADSAYDWAQDTIEGILDWIVGNEHITDNQITAIENIWEKGA